MKYKSAIDLQLPRNLDDDAKQRYIIRAKKDVALRIGEMIGEIATWQEVADRHILEVEAFSIGDWINFKNEIRQMIKECESANRSTFDLIQVVKLITSVEKKGIEK